MEYLTIMATVLSAIGTFVTGWATWNIYRVTQQQRILAMRQQRLEELRLRHELYDKRYAVFQAVKEFIFQVMDDDDVTDEALLRFVRGTAESEFLFQPEISAYLGEIQVKADELSRRVKRIREGRLPAGEQGTKISREVEELRLWFKYQYPDAHGKFKRYLSIPAELLQYIPMT